MVGGAGGAATATVIDDSYNFAAEYYDDGSADTQRFLDSTKAEIDNYPAVEATALGFRANMTSVYGSACIEPLVENSETYNYDWPMLDEEEVQSILLDIPSCNQYAANEMATEDFARFLPSEGYQAAFDYEDSLTRYENAVDYKENDDDFVFWHKIALATGALAALIGGVIALRTARVN